MSSNKAGFNLRVKVPPTHPTLGVGERTYGESQEVTESRCHSFLLQRIP